MPIQFRCPGCDTLMQVGEDVAGRQARCPKCQTVSTVPAAESEAPAPPEEEAVSPTRTDKPRKKPAAKSRRYDDEDDEPRPVRKPVKKSSSAGPVLILLGVGTVFLACLGCAGVGGWFVLNRASPPLGEADDDPNHPFGPVPDRVFPGDGGQPVAEAPVKVAFVKGKFETELPRDVNPANPNILVTRRYQLDAKAGAVYRVQVGGDFGVTVRVEGPAGPLQQPRDRFGNEMRLDFAFHAAQAGAWTVSVERPAFENQPRKLTIREMDGTEPLPEPLKLPPPLADLPRVEKVQELNVYDKQFSGAAFAPDNKSFWMAHGDGTLSLWSHPELKKQGSYKATSRLYALGVDRKGRLYAQVTNDRNPISVAQRVVGDVSVWEGAGPAADNVPLPAPTKTVPLRGIVQRFVSAPDGRWLYFLDTHNRKLARIDPDKAAVDKEIDALSPGVKAFCLTPDGKKIYCCADTNRIDIIDAQQFKVEKSVRLDKGQPCDVAASNEGLVFLVGQRVELDLLTSSNCFLVDLTRGAPEQADVMPVNTGAICRFVEMLPDQRAVLFSGDRRVITCSLPSRPALFRPLTREQHVRDYYMPGQIVVSPDGRTLLHDTGTILSISR